MITNMKQQRNFQYRRALAELDMLNHRRRNLDRDLRRLELEGGMAPKEYLKALDDQRVKISAELTKIKTSHPKPAAPYADVKRQRLVDTLLGKTLATQQPLRDYSEPTVIGRIDNCEVYFHQIDHPTFQRYQDNQTSGDDTELDLSLEEYFYPDQNNLQCYVNIIDKTHWYCFDKAEYLCQHLLHIYEIPAPSCDSEVTWWANFDTAIHGAWGDAEWGWLRVTPFFYVSPNATIPSANTLMELAGNYLEYNASISWDNGPEKSTTGNSPKSYRGLYDVKAGQKSIVCFVITVDLFVREGQMGARAYGSTRTYQNAY